MKPRCPARDGRNERRRTGVSGTVTDSVASRAGTAGSGVDEKTRTIQRIELDILSEFVRRCEAASLRWFVIGGTALGAARHAGFIPWDDDIDVGMPRPDYDRFEALSRASSDLRYVWQSALTDRSYPFAFGKLLRGDTRVIEPAMADLPVRQGLYIDVFPLDGAPPSGLIRRIHGIAWKLAVTGLSARIRRNGMRRLLAYGFRAVPRSWFLGLMGRLVRAFPYDSSPFVVNASGAWGYGRECQPRSRFEPSSSLEFEGLAVPVPGRWHEYLTQLYGDYLQPPPPEQRRPRHDLTIVSLGEGGTASGNASDSDAPAPPLRGVRRRRIRRAAIAKLGMLAVRSGFAIGSLRRPRPYVVLAPANGSEVGGNLLAIDREIARRSPPIDVKVVRYRIRPGLRGRIVSAIEAFRAGYHLASSRLFIVDDFFFPMYAIRPRRATARVQVWHAAGALKKVGYSVLEKSFGVDDELIRLVPVHTNYDVALVSSSAATPHYMDAFRLPSERFTSALGLPRTDTFFDAARRAAATEAIHARYGLPSDVKVLLYAPTFRGETVLGARYDHSLDLAVMRDALADRWRLLVRLHPFVRDSLAIGPDLHEFVTDASDWPDINELMFVADMLVTDYSSAIFEYALLGRPMAFFAPDLEAYEAERGFYIDYRTALPGPVFETTGDLATYVARDDLDTGRTRAFAETWFDIADGHASERFVDRIVIPALRGEALQIEPEPRPEDRVIGRPGPT